MNKFQGESFKYEPKSKFVTRYAQLTKEKEELNSATEKEEFNLGYRKGSLRTALAHKYLKLTNCGLNTLVEADTDVIWKCDGDTIIRLQSDLTWVDEFLNQEGK